jgi:hypothetical protein
VLCFRLDPTDSWSQQRAVKDDRACCKPLTQISATQNHFILPSPQEPCFDTASPHSSPAQSSVYCFKIGDFASPLLFLDLNCKETEIRMPLSGDKTNILLLPKPFEGQSDKLIFVSRLEDATTPCRHDLRLRELSSCPTNIDCKVAIFHCPLCLTLCLPLLESCNFLLACCQGS